MAKKNPCYSKTITTITKRWHSNTIRTLCLFFRIPLTNVLFLVFLYFSPLSFLFGDKKILLVIFS